MGCTGWKRLLADRTWCRGQGNFPLPAYSEYMPPPWVALKPYGTPVPSPQIPDDNFGWAISEYEWADQRFRVANDALTARSARTEVKSGRKWDWLTDSPTARPEAGPSRLSKSQWIPP